MGLSDVNKGGGKREGSVGRRKIVVLSLTALALAVMFLAAVLAFVTFGKLFFPPEKTADSQFIPAGSNTPVAMASSTSTSLATTSLTTSTTSSTSSSTSSSSTTSTSTTTVDGVLCHGKTISNEMLSGGGGIPDGDVKVVFCIDGFGQQRAYTSVMENIKHKKGVVRASITYMYPIGYVVYNPDEVTTGEIISLLGDYTISVVKDGIT